MATVTKEFISQTITVDKKQELGNFDPHFSTPAPPAPPTRPQPAPRGRRQIFKIQILKFTAKMTRQTQTQISKIQILDSDRLSLLHKFNNKFSEPAPKFCFLGRQTARRPPPPAPPGGLGLAGLISIHFLEIKATFHQSVNIDNHSMVKIIKIKI
jgi:hypothetical protein